LFIGPVQELIDDANTLLLLDPSLLRFLVFGQEFVIYFPTRACLDSLASGDEQRWSSLALGSFALVRDRLHRYRRSPARWSRPSPRLLPAPVSLPDAFAACASRHRRVELKAGGMTPSPGNVFANSTTWFPHLPPKLPGPLSR
jgi:hypothetical protein